MTDLLDLIELYLRLDPLKTGSILIANGCETNTNETEDILIERLEILDEIEKLLLSQKKRFL